MNCKQRMGLLEPKHKYLSVRQQCDLLSLNRSSLYYEQRPVSDEDLNFMRLLDEQYTQTPFYGVLRMTAYLRRLGYVINEKHVRRLLREMGLFSIYPKTNLSKQNQAHKIFPYLLKGVEINRPNQVWSTDITYIRIKKGFVYLVAVIDWYSRYVLSHEISTSMEVDFCINALERSLQTSRCEIFNSDQGSQFTAQSFVSILQSHQIKVSMDGKGRAFDNIFVERLWRSLKYELVYINELESVADAKQKIGDYFKFYNNKRLHQSLKYQTPYEVYYAQ